MPSNVQTKLSERSRSVINVKAIKFITPPRYRNFEVDISGNNIVELYRLVNMSGNNEGGRRAEIPHLGQGKGKCKVIISNAKYEIVSNYSGRVSLGIEDV